jgi:serine/threonine protein kinase
MAGHIDIGGAFEVADLLGVTRQRVASLRARPSFPEPLAELAAGPIFDLDEIRRWAASSRRRSGRPRNSPDRILGGRYLLEGSPIGRGGFGEVFKATDRQAGEDDRAVVAVKVLHPKEDAEAVDFDRFRREQQILSQHHHPNVMRALNHGEEADGTLWYVMALAQGSLSARIDSIAGNIPNVVDVIRQVAAGIGHLHAHAIIHRDVKPANVLQLRSAVWAVSDLGLARRIGPHETTTLTETGEGVGSLWFTAPEQWTDAKSVYEAADIFGLGRVLHVLLTGGEGPITDIKHDGLRAVVRRATDSAPSHRYRSVDNFLKALDYAVVSPIGRWRTKSEDVKDRRQRLGERLHNPTPDPPAVSETRDLIAASADDDELLKILDHVVPYLPGPAVVALWNEDPDGWREFLGRLADHMRHRAYDFSFTDQIAAFYRKCLTASEEDPEVMKWSVLALVRVGAYHNRWRVRDTVTSMLQSARTAEQALAVADAIRTSDEDDVHWSIAEVSLGTLHPAIVGVIHEVTGVNPKGLS